MLKPKRSGFLEVDLLPAEALDAKKSLHGFKGRQGKFLGGTVLLKVLLNGHTKVRKYLSIK